VSVAVYAILMLWDCYVITDAGSRLYYGSANFDWRGLRGLGKLLA